MSALTTKFYRTREERAEAIRLLWPKARDCKACGEPFDPLSDLQEWCSLMCAVEDLGVAIPAEPGDGVR